jgi:alpha-amylase/alpha-mannosidase (GH57 family)
MTQVAFLWHMHQPYYEDLITREHVLPWVRLHALKDYFGMVALLREFPQVRMTFNLVPSLLVQLEAFAENRARDRFLEIGLKPAADLTEAEAAFILENFFHAHRPRMIDPYPRYAELLARRGPLEGTTPAAAVRRFTANDLRDLQVWQKLAWIDPFYLEGDERVQALVRKQRQFDEGDKQALRVIELELLNKVIPEYRAAAMRGQVELSTSPFYHPILPLLCDTDIYKRTHPFSRMPRRRFRHPEDAFEQLSRAAACHERLFGKKPTGLWPSEGSVSDEMIPLAVRAGFHWMATDELILARTLGVTLGRDAEGQLEHPEYLYTPYQVHAGGASVDCVFRDHALSDLVGFTYAGWPAEAAADDFLAKIREAGRRYSAATGREGTIFVILDGENAWEYYDGGGRPFLRALYSRLSRDGELRTVTMGEACSRKGPSLSGLFPGSWIDANFYIWIGHPDDQKAWDQLGDARDAIGRATGSETALAQAREELFIAEGSDWCWWYGDDHSSDHDHTFDDLFRRHLRNVYQLLGQPIPDELFVTNISTAETPSHDAPLTGLIRPTLDGEETSYFEWLGAGHVEIRSAAGAMHQIERPPARIAGIDFGFDREALFVRVDGVGAVRDWLVEGNRLTLRFLQPVPSMLVVRQPNPRAPVVAELLSAQGEVAGSSARPVDQPKSVVGSIAEIRVPLSAIGAGPGGDVAFFVALETSANVELERHPSGHPIELRVPDQRFEAVNWTA